MWLQLRGRKVGGWKFRRQQPIGEYFVDFYCPAARLIIEVDGPRHYDDDRLAYDARRHAWLKSQGYRLHRIPVDYIDADISVVVDDIRQILGEITVGPIPAFGGTSP
jgi:very-short-patch-repair endonuclease